MILTADRFGRPEVITVAGWHYPIGDPGSPGDLTRLDEWCAWAAESHPGDIDELLDARNVLAAEAGWRLRAVEGREKARTATEGQNAAQRGRNDAHSVYRQATTQTPGGDE